jgi:beta-galactosidase
MHYARIPHELWRDRILRAKRAGMNCIATYVHWNFHERQEGVFDFHGDADIERYIDLCQELGVYFFARVGPFVSGEWEAGGYPGWLLGKPGTEVRTANNATRLYVRRWFEQLIPRIARRQVTRGGPVILVQLENEYPYVNRPGSCGISRLADSTRARAWDRGAGERLQRPRSENTEVVQNT